MRTLGHENEGTLGHVNEGTQPTYFKSEGEASYLATLGRRGHQAVKQVSPVRPPVVGGLWVVSPSVRPAAASARMMRHPSHFMACFCFLAFVYCAKRKLDTCAYMLVAAAFYAASAAAIECTTFSTEKRKYFTNTTSTVAEEKELPGQKLG